MKTCPYCAEEIQDEAIVCRWCGRDLAPEAVRAVNQGLSSSEQSEYRPSPDTNRFVDHNTQSNPGVEGQSVPPWIARADRDAAIGIDLAGGPQELSTSAQQANTVDRSADTQGFWSRYKIFIIYGSLMAIPFPFVGWLWLALGLWRGYKAGWPQGLYGFVLQLGAAIGLRFFLGVLLVALDVL